MSSGSRNFRRGFPFLKVETKKKNFFKVLLNYLFSFSGLTLSLRSTNSKLCPHVNWTWHMYFLKGVSVERLKPLVSATAYIHNIHSLHNISILCQRDLIEYDKGIGSL